MSRRMLINAQRPEEVRVAIVTDRTLDAYEVAASESGLTRGNIYRGVVVSIQPSLDAAFVEYGAERHGLLRVDDLVPQAYHRPPGEGERRPRVERVLERNRPVLVQVVRDAVAAKGSLLTSNISLAGRYLVLMPFDEIRGVSRRTDDDEARKEVRERLAGMSLPEGAGVIARTNALDQPKTTLNRDLNALVRLWKDVQSAYRAAHGPSLLYSDQDLIVQALRDLLDATIGEVLVDDDEAFDKVEAYMKTFMPRAKTRLVRYAERMPLFSRFGLEEQIDRIYQRRVDLPGGGSIVIDHTEALTAIDVNSGRATRATSQEEAVTGVNLEAAREVARQLRLRDIGGLVVVDFIDMRSHKHQRQLEKTLRDAMKDDKARFSVGRLSANGLVEINRQRLKKALQLRRFRACPTCSGTGTIASPELVGLNVLRRIEARAAAGSLARVRFELHPELADAIQNERRRELTALETEFDIRIDVIASPALHRSEERVEWTNRDPGAATKKPAPAAALSAADLAGDQRRPDRAATPPATAEDGESSERSRRRKRGGRKRKKLTASPVEGEVEAVEAAEDLAEAPGEGPEDGASQAPAESPEEEASPARAKRRKRGGRRRKKPAQDDGADPAEATEAGAHLESEAAPPADTGEAPATDTGEAETAAKTKRRRRGGRKHKRKTDEGGTEPSSEPEPEA